MTLYHYTCDHSYSRILRDGFLRPGVDGLIWLTDLEPPAPRLALGLTSFALDCDRMAHVFTVDRTTDVQWWMDYRKTHRELLGKEDCPGVMPRHWFVSKVSLLVRAEVNA